MTRGGVFGAFGGGEEPTIACINQATVGLGVDFAKLVNVLQEYVDRLLAPVWAAPARLVRATGFLKGAWAMAFLDDADAQDALGYHDLTPEGLPLAKVFVKTTLDDGQMVSVTASHELAEMLVDPAVNLLSTGPNSKLVYAYESADPVEEVSFRLRGVPLSDFVYPSYFEDFHKPGSIRFDYSRKVRRPFQILPGGYQLVFRNGKWSQIYGSKAKRMRFEREDRRGHRSLRRIRPSAKKSRPRWGKVVGRSPRTERS
jgi:hypothetical protein